MSKSSITQTTSNLGKDEYLETRVRKYKKQPNYYRVGNGTMNRHEIKSVDLLDEVMNMTSAERLVISTIKNAYPWDNQDNEVYLKLSEVLSKSNHTVFRKGFKLLEAKGLVKRTKISHYMINPNAFIPFDYEKAQSLWLATEPKEKPTEEEQK